MHPLDKPKQSDTDPVWMSINGSIELGEIDEKAASALGIKGGPIRIAEGFAGPKGYGYLHIKGYQSRVGQLIDIGFKSLDDCLSEVAKNWTHIVADEDASRLGLILSWRGRSLKVVIQLRSGANGFCWSIVTAIPGRKPQAKDIRYEREK